MKDTDFGWLHRRLPQCWCGAGPAKLNDNTPVITYLDLNDKGTFYVRWRCTECHAIVCNSLKLFGDNPPVENPDDRALKIKYAHSVEFGEPNETIRQKSV